MESRIFFTYLLESFPEFFQGLKKGFVCSERFIKVFFLALVHMFLLSISVS